MVLNCMYASFTLLIFIVTVDTFENVKFDVNRKKSEKNNKTFEPS